MSESMFAVRDAGEKGKGIFTTVNIRPGDVVMQYEGEEKWIWDIPEDLWQYTFQVDYDRYILPAKGSPGWFLNHSCNPNCVIMGRNRIVASTLIRAGDELTIDYSTNVGWDGFAMECRCGAAGCRRLIRSYKYLDPGIKGRYGACVSSFLVERRRSSEEGRDE